MNRTIEGMFQIYHQLLGITVKKYPDYQPGTVK